MRERAVPLLTQPEDPNFASQEQVYNDIGKEMLEHAFEGCAEREPHTPLFFFLILTLRNPFLLSNECLSVNLVTLSLTLSYSHTLSHIM